ncbi:prephenate dehydrogenase [Rhodococcus spelaei]|uniref:Prephenate dehydrogenase n=1 Tax=Rhodococcus spelaei TaxID=2546320 RepID=A0A541BR94_9NOCA|nr:prephenate dehydrogenase [Rhodococcus spelaei]TQF74862.1 prephenate dehydrogenase [Rhodococcus spelaei]
MCQPVRVSAESTDPPVCVLGLGLIGGSLLRAAVAAGRTAWGYNRSAGAVDEAVGDGYDAGTDLAAALERAQTEGAVVVVAVPEPALDAVLTQVALSAPDCTLTDVVSVKGAVLAAVRRHVLAARFVGGHPMAGTAHSGWSAGDASLFRDAVWVVAAEDDTDPEAWRQVAHLALDCGSVVVPAGAREHDAAVARISHLPHLLAEALAVTAAAGGDLALGLAAGSFRDCTRVAGTAPDLVRAMCEANSEALTVALDEALRLLSEARDALAEHRSTETLVHAGHAARLRYENLQRWEITDITVGEPGWAPALREAGRNGGAFRDRESFRPA